MQIQILDDAGNPWATFSRRDVTQAGRGWVDEDGDELPEGYQAALDGLASTVREDPYWVVSVNRGRP